VSDLLPPGGSGRSESGLKIAAHPPRRGRAQAPSEPLSSAVGKVAVARSAAVPAPPPRLEAARAGPVRSRSAKAISFGEEDVDADNARVPLGDAAHQLKPARAAATATARIGRGSSRRCRRSPLVPDQPVRGQNRSTRSKPRTRNSVTKLGSGHAQRQGARDQCQCSRAAGTAQQSDAPAHCGTRASQLQL